MISLAKHAAFAAVLGTAVGMLGSSGAAAMPVDTRLAARAAEESDLQQVQYRRYGYAGYGYRRYAYGGYGYRRPFVRYGYVRPYWRPRYYGYAPAYYAPAYYSYAPAYYSYAPAYYYGYPRYGFFGGPRFSISFGFGPRWGW
jgi:hypothetical protein